MHGFYGTFMHTLDPKNRVFVPAKLRNDLGESFYITRKLTKKALAVYPAAGLINYFCGKYLVLINKSPTSADRMADLVIRENIGEVMGKILQEKK